MRLIQVLAIVLASAPHAQAGTMLNPEVIDPPGDADAPHADILGAWVEQDAEALGFFIQTSRVGEFDAGAGALSPDPGSGQAFASEVAEGVDWVLRFQGNGSAWEFRRTHRTQDEASPDAVPFTANKWLLLRDGTNVLGPGNGLGADPVYRQVLDAQSNTFGVRWLAYPSGLPNGTRLTGIHAFSLSTQTVDQNTVACAGETVRDCAPETGFGRDFTVGNASVAAIADLGLALDEAALTLAPGTGRQVGFTLKSTSPDQHRTFTLDAKAPPGWTATVTPSSQHLPPGESATGSLDLGVPGEAVPGVYNVTLRAEHEGRLTQATLTVSLPGDGIQAALPRLAGPQWVQAHAGEPTEFTVNVTNAGTAAYRGQFRAMGPAAAWLTLPPLLPVEPGQTVAARFLVDVPHDAAPGEHNLTLSVDGSDDLALAVEVEEHHARKEAPIPGWLALAALAAVAFRRRKA